MLDAGSPSHPIRSWRLPKGRRPRGREGFVARAARGCQMVRGSAPDGGPSRAAAGAQSELEAGRGLQPEPVQRRRRCRRARPTTDCADPAKRIAPKVSLSLRIASEARRDRPRGRPSEDERAGRGERGGAWRDGHQRGVVGLSCHVSGARRRRARGGAEAIDERTRSERADVTHRARGSSRERRDLLPTRRGCASTLRQLLGGLEVA
jgi:hypothetical protein